MITTEEQKYIRLMGIRKVSEYFSDMLCSKWPEKKIPILVEDSLRTEVWYEDCDDLGRPRRKYIETLTFSGISAMMWTENTAPDFSTCTAYKNEIEIMYPLVYQENHFNYFPETQYFLWKGETRSKKEIPIERLNVSELMKVAQEVVRKREGIVLDDVLKNKLIK